MYGAERGAEYRAQESSIFPKILLFLLQLDENLDVCFTVRV